MVEENEANAPVAEGRRQGAKEPAHKPDFWARRPAKTLRIVLHVFNAIVVAVSSVVAIVAAIFDLAVLSSYSQVARCRNKVSGVIVIVVVAIGIGLAVYGSYSASKWKRQGLHVEAGGVFILVNCMLLLTGLVVVFIVGPYRVKNGRI